MAVALSKFKHRSADKVIQKLQSLRKENEEGLIWWSDNRTDVLTTAYALMALLNLPGGNNLPILKWLIQQRNEKGDFKTTHETVVALEALVGFSQIYNTTNWNMKVSYSAKDNNGNTKKGSEFFINRQNALTLQQHEVRYRKTKKCYFITYYSFFSYHNLHVEFSLKLKVEAIL